MTLIEKTAVIMESINTRVYAIQPEEEDGWQVAIYHALCDIEEKSPESGNSQSKVKKNNFTPLL
ncbi:hypothetical protein INP51_14045 [Blautia liquoris]|uniref:Uncharacterized protein n=1 Tax=Blautia liquoris TaxID=2779518 RepID=A0A7M2RI75_9FIRM|nr:hypothetical protein [Blautia liquoris]QOV19062.1 hypothetical protein INP51_14045 [Blautia liquoris]